MTSGLVYAVLGGLGFVLIGAMNLEKELLVLAGFFAGFGSMSCHNSGMS